MIWARPRRERSEERGERREVAGRVVGDSLPVDERCPSAETRRDELETRGANPRFARRDRRELVELELSFSSSLSYDKMALVANSLDEIRALANTQPTGYTSSSLAEGLQDDVEQVKQVVGKRCRCQILCNEDGQLQEFIVRWPSLTLDRTAYEMSPGGL